MCDGNKVWRSSRSESWKHEKSSNCSSLSLFLSDYVVVNSTRSTQKLTTLDSWVFRVREEQKKTNFIIKTIFHAATVIAERVAGDTTEVTEGKRAEKERKNMVTFWDQMWRSCTISSPFLMDSVTKKRKFFFVKTCLQTAANAFEWIWLVQQSVRWTHWRERATDTKMNCTDD